MRKSGRQNIFIRRKLNKANSNNKPTKAVTSRKKMQISEIWYFFYQLSFDIIHKTHADYVTSDVCSYPAVKRISTLCRFSFNFFSLRWTLIGRGILYLAGEKYFHMGAFQLGNACDHPAGAQGCKTFSFSWHSLDLTACKRNTECTTGAQFAVTRWWIDNWQPPQANPRICFPPPLHTPQRLNPCHNDKQRPVVPDANLCVWGKCAVLRNENSSLTHTHIQPTFHR